MGEEGRACPRFVMRQGGEGSGGTTKSAGLNFSLASVTGFSTNWAEPTALTPHPLVPEGSGSAKIQNKKTLFLKGCSCKISSSSFLNYHLDIYLPLKKIPSSLKNIPTRFTGLSLQKQPSATERPRPAARSTARPASWGLERNSQSSGSTAHSSERGGRGRCTQWRLSQEAGAALRAAGAMRQAGCLGTQPGGGVKWEVRGGPGEFPTSDAHTCVHRSRVTLV